MGSRSGDSARRLGKRVPLTLNPADGRVTAFSVEPGLQPSSETFSNSDGRTILFEAFDSTGQEDLWVKEGGVSRRLIVGPHAPLAWGSDERTVITLDPASLDLAVVGLDGKSRVIGRRPSIDSWCSPVPRTTQFVCSVPVTASDAWMIELGPSPR